MKIREAYELARAATANRTAWVRISTIQAFTGGSPRQLAEEINQLMATDEHFLAEPQPHRHRITEDDRRYAPVIGGEARHLIAWQ
jgi:hypothetical protein